jgi:hypothetical protein
VLLATLQRLRLGALSAPDASFAAGATITERTKPARSSGCAGKQATGAPRTAQANCSPGPVVGTSMLAELVGVSAAAPSAPANSNCWRQA